MRAGSATVLLTTGDEIPGRAARYEAWFGTPIGRAMDAAEARAVLGLTSVQAGERTLDAGCGTGTYTRRLAERGARVTGVDTDPEMLGAARIKVPSATLVEADVMQLPFADASFDLSLAVTLLCFVDDPQRAVAELIRVTRPGGRVILAELNRRSLWTAWRRVESWQGSRTWQDAKFFSPRELADLLRNAGIDTIRTEAAAYLPPKAPTWLRVRATAFERRAHLFGSIGAALSLARGDVSELSGG